MKHFASFSTFSNILLYTYTLLKPIVYRTSFFAAFWPSTCPYKLCNAYFYGL